MSREEKTPSTTETRTIWLLDPSGYRQWTVAERDVVEDFLRGNGIDPRDVGISDGAPQLAVRSTPEGWVLDGWVFDRSADGKVVVCPHCPGCVKRKRVTVPCVAEPPSVSTSWSAFEPSA